MARCARALLPLLLLACALARSSHCSRSPPPGEPQKPGVVVVPSHSPVADHGGADNNEPRGGETAATGQVRLVEKEAAGANAGYGAAASAFGNGGVGSEQRGAAAALLVQQRAPLRRMMLLSSRLARGLVLGGDAEDSAAAGASCRSNNAHITCAPPAPH